MTDKKYLKLIENSSYPGMVNSYIFALDFWQTEFLDDPKIKEKYEELNSKKYYKVHNTDLIISLNLLLKLFDESNIVYDDWKMYMVGTNIEFNKDYSVSYSINRKESLKNIFESNNEIIRRIK